MRLTHPLRPLEGLLHGRWKLETDNWGPYVYIIAVLPVSLLAYFIKWLRFHHGGSRRIEQRHMVTDQLVLGFDPDDLLSASPVMLWCSLAFMWSTKRRYPRPRAHDAPIP